MSRVCLKNDPDITGRIVGKGRLLGEVKVQWDDREDAHFISQERIRPLCAAEIIETLEQLRDSFNLAIGCAIEDIKRVK